jgi:UDPglucose 6-dehydrogenase
MKIAVIGTGYVGLVAGAGFSNFGNEVVCADIDADRVRALERGEIPFHEPGLEELVARNARQGRLRFATDTNQAVAGAQIIFLTVGTPPEASGAVDMHHIEDAARNVARGLDAGAVVVTKSTVPVGTTERIGALMREQSGRDLAVASNPEFLREGDAVNDFMHPQRVIVGTDDDRARALLRTLYAPILGTGTGDRFHAMDIRSAELAKYACNTMLAARLSLMNELALLAERVDADIEHVRRALGADGRIGSSYLFPGAGFGGSCLPKDLRALVHIGHQAGMDMTLASAVHEVNERQLRVLGDRVIAYFGDDIRTRRIAVWGLSFKPETDDIRDAPALVLIEQLLDAGAEVVAYDPVARERAHARLGSAARFAEDMYAAAEGSDALVLVTEWHQFRRPDFERLARIMRAPVMVDGRNIWNPDELRGMGFIYYGVGRSRGLR